MPFDRIWEKPTKDGYDLAAGGLSQMRGRRALWSEPYSEVRRSALTRGASQTGWKSYEDIPTFAAVLGSAAFDHAKKNRPHHPPIPVSSLKDGLNLLEKGAIAALGTGHMSARHLIQTSPLPLQQIDLHTPGDFPEQICFSVSPQSPELLQKLNYFLIKMKGYQI